VLNDSEPANLILFLGATIGAQIGIVYYTHNHAGLPIDGGFGESILLTIDNLFHGVFLHVFELFKVSFGPTVEHGTLSGSVFYLFRLAYDALVLLFLYECYQRWKMRHLFKGFPYEPRKVEELLGWLEARCGDEEKWPHRYLDEFLFLILAKEYLRGHDDIVEVMSRQFPWLGVTPEVRGLFVDRKGKVVFYGSDPE
jgi:hypothetical protein